MPKLSDINPAVLLTIVIVFAYLFYISMEIDRMHDELLKREPSHKEVALPSISDKDRLIIESVIENYKKKKRLNKSNCAKIMDDVWIGMFRGAIVGMMLSGGTDGAISGAIVYGAVSGIITSYRLVHPSSKKVINVAKAT